MSRDALDAPVRISALLVFGASAGCFPSFPDDCFERGCAEGFVCVAGGRCEAEGNGGGDELRVASTRPAAHAVAGAASRIDVTFSQAMLGADANGFSARSSVDGPVEGDYAGDGTPTLSLTPSSPMRAGADVEVVIRGGLQSTGDEALEGPFVFRFRVATAPAALDFTPADEVEGNFLASRSARLANLDDDAELELALTTGPETDAIHIADIGANGSITLRAGSLDVGAVNDFAIGDLDGDGQRDLFIASGLESGGTRPYLGRDGSVFTAGPVVASALRLHRVRLGDLDGDGDLDFAATLDLADQAEGAGENVVIGLGRGDATFALSDALDSGAGAGTARELDLADMDNDGDLDLVVLNDDTTRSNGRVAVLFNDGEGAFPLRTADPQPEVAQTNLALRTGDFDGDGDADVVVASRVPSVVTVLQNDGAARLTALPAVSADADGLAVGDLDGDGDLDVATSGGDILLNAAGDGDLVPGESVGSGGIPSVADLDADGDLDAVFVGTTLATPLRTFLNE